MDSLVIVILTRNRPDQVLMAIDSVLAQSDKNFSLLISDNSDDLCTDQVIQEKILTQLQPINISYVKRSLVLRVDEHINACIDDIKSGYFCLFHDDDLMLPNFVFDFWDAQKKFPNFAALGFNAIADKGGQLGKLFFDSPKSFITNLSSRQLAKKYFSRHQLGISPFPSYVYRKEKLNNLVFPVLAGKYSDVRWLLEIAMVGQVVWVNKPAMIYRLHDSNDSLVESRRDRLIFLGFIKKNVKYFGYGLLRDYRFFLYKKFYPKTMNNKLFIHRSKLLKCYLSFYRISRWGRLDHHYQFFSKILVRALYKLRYLRGMLS